MKKPFIIGITGGSGSGKTTFLKRLGATFGKHELCIVSQDDYYLPREQQKSDEQGVKNFDLPSSIDKKALKADVKSLINGESIMRQEYAFNNENSESKLLIIQPAPIIIIEGIFIFHFKKIYKLLDLRVFLHAKENLKVIRRIKRDQTERNYPVDDVLYRYEHHVLPTFERYIKPYREDADVIINNNQNFEGGLDVFVGFLKDKLKSLETTD